MHPLQAFERHWNAVFDWLLHHSIAPGYAVTVLGLFAAVAAFYIDRIVHKTAWRVILILVFTLLAATEAGIISADRREQGNNFDKIMQRFDFTATSLGIQMPI